VTGPAADIRPLDPRDPDVQKLALIELALSRNMPWTAIAAALGAKDKAAAKKIKAELEKRVKAKQLAVEKEPPCGTTISQPYASVNGTAQTTAT
jgi:hypothetical protein